MHNRIRQIINLETEGKVAEFARLFGWTPQYVTNLISGRVGIGIQPVIAILERYPNLDARWLLLGEGAMFRPDIVERTQKKLLALQELESYVPFMSIEELNEYNRGEVNFPAERTQLWQQKLQENCTSF